MAQLSAKDREAHRTRYRCSTSCIRAKGRDLTDREAMGQAAQTLWPRAAMSSSRWSHTHTHTPLGSPSPESRAAPKMPWQAGP